jgi:hypothetical protein
MMPDRQIIVTNSSVGGSIVGGDMNITHNNPNTEKNDIDSKAINDSWKTEELTLFRSALLDTYRDVSSLSIFVNDNLDINLLEITKEAGLVEMCFNLLEWCRKKGKLNEIVLKFLLENSRKESLEFTKLREIWKQKNSPL